MKMCEHNRIRRSGLDLRGLWKALPFLVIVLGIPVNFVCAQAPAQGDLSQEIQKLTTAMAHAQAQLEESQRQLDEMRNQLNVLQHQMAQSGANAGTQSPPVPMSQAKP